MVRLRWSKCTDSPTRGSRSSNYETTVLGESKLQYAAEKGESSAQESYQEISGAPVESRSPLGYHVGPITILFLNLSKMVGTGVYSTPAIILKSTGSVGLALIYWFIGFLIASASLSIYQEFASYFPNRSGSLTVYLEQSFPRPRYFFPVTFAIQTVILSSSASKAIVLANYLFRIGHHTPSAWELKRVAVAGHALAFLFVVFSTKFSYRVSNAIGLAKLLTLVFIGVTGLVVLSVNVPRVPDPKANFHNMFSSFPGAQASAYGGTNALYKIIFSYGGYENAFNVVNENPVKSIRNSGGLALFVVAILYILANIAYFAAVPKEELVQAKQVAASLFFTHVFGSSGAVKGLNFLIALSAFGSLVTVLLGQSRLIRECGRQGVLPFLNFWVSTRPFGTPLGPYLSVWGLTLVMIMAPPTGDAFMSSNSSNFQTRHTLTRIQNFVVDLAIYPSSFFLLFMAIGIYSVRYQRKKLGIPKPAKGYAFPAWHVAVILTILVNAFLLLMPWYPPPGGAKGGDDFGIGILIACGVYYVLWIYAIPKWCGYRVRHERVVLDGGEITHKLG